MSNVRLASLLALTTLTACAGGESQRDDSDTATSTATDDPSSSESSGTACVPGAQSECACPGGGEGIQVCNADGTALGDCECEDTTGPDPTTEGSDSSGAPDPCGDGTCDEDETCDACPEDCGECIPCTLAPTCEGAQIPPVIETHAKNLDDIMLSYVPPEDALANITALLEQSTPGMRIIIAALDEARPDELAYVGHLRATFENHPAITDALRRQLAAANLQSLALYRDAHPEPRAADIDLTTTDPHHGGTARPCEDPRLRVRVARIDVPEEDDDVLNDQIYCLIAGEGTESSELKLTPITPALDEGDGHDWALGEGVVWGQMDLAAPRGNLALTYNCIESESVDTYNALLGAIGDAAEEAGGVFGDSENGWVFDAVGVLGNLLPSVLMLDGDDQLFNASQIIAEDQHLELTAGAWWTVARSGTNINSDWEWHLRMEIWGCHDNAD
jgi:hypothetical protein